MTEINITKIVIPKKIYRMIAASARRGAKRLDEKVPDWHERIDTGTLEMQNSCHCVYGQLGAETVFSQINRRFPNGNDGGEQYGYTPPDKAVNWADASGYDSGNTLGITEFNDAVWDALQEEWLREIYIRRTDLNSNVSS